MFIENILSKWFFKHAKDVGKNIYEWKERLNKLKILRCLVLDVDKSSLHEIMSLLQNFAKDPLY
jgi:hypothetical protein